MSKKKVKQVKRVKRNVWLDVALYGSIIFGIIYWIWFLGLLVKAGVIRF